MVQKDFHKLLIALSIVVVLGGAAYAFQRYGRYFRENVPTPVDRTELVADASTQTQETRAEVEAPEELNLEMAFYAQAPFGNWDYPWQEACEEASILLVANEYYAHNWSADQFNQEILELVEWQKERFGDYWHTTADQTAEMARTQLGLESVLHENPTVEDIQNILAKGHFIVAFFDGKTLENPFFTNGGPVYHVLVVKGYKANGGIITHDVGTRRGADYVYTWETFDTSLHDYAVPMQSGTPVILEMLPPT